MNFDWSQYKFPKEFEIADDPKIIETALIILKNLNIDAKMDRRESNRKINHFMCDVSEMKKYPQKIRPALNIAAKRIIKKWHKK